MAMSGGRDDGEPMMEMNTTPLIDVLAGSSHHVHHYNSNPNPRCKNRSSGS